MKNENHKYSCGTDDITFCMSDCDEVRCFRHPTNILQPWFPHSMSDLKGSELCELERIKEQSK